MVLFMLLYFGLIGLCVGICVWYRKEKKEEEKPCLTDIQEQLVLDRLAFYKEYTQHLKEVYNQGTISLKQRKKEERLIIREVRKLEKWLEEAKE